MSDYYPAWNIERLIVANNKLRHERDEARQVARRLYKRFGDEHVAYISMDAVADYWMGEAAKLRRELDDLRDAYAILQRLYEVTNPPDNNLG